MRRGPAQSAVGPQRQGRQILFFKMLKKFTNVGIKMLKCCVFRYIKCKFVDYLPHDRVTRYRAGYRTLPWNKFLVCDWRDRGAHGQGSSPDFYQTQGIDFISALTLRSALPSDNAGRSRLPPWSHKIRLKLIW